MHTKISLSLTHTHTHTHTHISAYLNNLLGVQPKVEVPKDKIRQLFEPLVCDPAKKRRLLLEQFKVK